MRAPRDRRHIIVRPSRGEDYLTHRKGGGKKPPAPADRVAHARELRRALEAAVGPAETGSGAPPRASIQVAGAEPGVFLQVKGRPGIELPLDQWESASKGGQVVAVQRDESATSKESAVERATIFVTRKGVAELRKRLEKYSKPEPKRARERRHEAMLDPAASVRRATLADLWTDATRPFPQAEEELWWEVWLRENEGREVERFLSFAQSMRVTVGKGRIYFPDRTVLLAKTTATRLGAALDVLQDLAEVRAATETPRFFLKLTPPERADWGEDLERRLELPGPSAPAVTLLDTGVNRGHRLLAPLLAEADCHTCQDRWGKDDRDGHGTEMAGLALYGDLVAALTTRERVVLRHRLESVKVFEPAGPRNEPSLYGAITAEATARVEVEQPQRRRCFSLTVTAPEGRDRGQPTSWSAAVDALATGVTIDLRKGGVVPFEQEENPTRRLFLISAANVNPIGRDHLERSDATAVEDPAQAWNALTVGAVTNLPKPSSIPPGRQPVAGHGELSPYSTTSVPFADQWPIKPEILLEGGNAYLDGEDGVDPAPPECNLLSTSREPARSWFCLTWATSAATAQAARMAAILAAEYSDLWPESVRALLVHSADWTPPMRAYIEAGGSKKERVRRMRRYGFGVPDLQRALFSATDALTLIAQSEIIPFVLDARGEMRLFELPWPREVLAQLDAEVTLKITLSYFIEPRPGSRGWREKHTYTSHGLRFEVKNGQETVEQFRKRINKAALDEEESKPRSTTSDNAWFLGPMNRYRGSVHSDTWTGTAAELAERGVVAVFPVTGWRRNGVKNKGGKRSKADAPPPPPWKTRFALVVSIESPKVEVDLWTPVSVQVGIAVKLED